MDTPEKHRVSLQVDEQNYSILALTGPDAQPKVMGLVTQTNTGVFAVLDAEGKATLASRTE